MSDYRKRGSGFHMFGSWKKRPDRNTVKNTARQVRERVQKAAEPVQKAVQKAAEPVQKAVQKAAEPAQKAVQKAVEPVQKAVQKAAEPVQRAVQKAAEPVQEAVEKPIQEAAQEKARSIPGDAENEEVAEQRAAVQEEGQETGVKSSTAFADYAEMRLRKVEKKKKKEKKDRSLYDWTAGKSRKNKGGKVSVDTIQVKLRNTVIGDGVPKICVPLTGMTEEEILSQAEAARAAEPDLVEWRADFYRELGDEDRMTDVLRKISAALGPIDLLFTVRSREEGGVSDLSAEKYRKVILYAASREEISAIDLEGRRSDLDMEVLTGEVRDRGKAVIESAHFMNRTPKKDEMTEILDQLNRTGADILKLAVMAKKPKDVLRLMEVTEAYGRTCGCPLITMAMGDLGRITRVSGRITGSAVTFGTAGSFSAPGQLPVQTLRAILKEL